MPELPDRVGATVAYTAHGRAFRVKRLSRSTWHLCDVAVTSRARFGTRTEIADDVRSTLDTGALPGGAKGRW